MKLDTEILKNKNEDDFIDAEVSKHLQSFVDDPEMKKCIRFITTEKKTVTTINKQVFIKVIKKLLSAITIEEGEKIQEDEDENNEASIDDNEMANTYIQNLSQSQSQNENQPHRMNQSSSQNRNEAQKNDGSRRSNDNSKDQICRYYKSGLCRRKQNCKFDHPKMCNKFRRFGLIKFNRKGCADDCELYHPPTCNASLRDKVCNRDKCRYFHLNKPTNKHEERKNENQHGFMINRSQLDPQNDQPSKLGPIGSQSESMKNENHFLDLQKTVQELTIQMSMMMRMMTAANPIQSQVFQQPYQINKMNGGQMQMQT